MPFLKLGFGGRGAGSQMAQRLPRQVLCSAGQVFERAHFAELRSLLDVFQVQHAGGDFKRAAALRGGIRERASRRTGRR